MRLNKVYLTSAVLLTAVFSCAYLIVFHTYGNYGGVILVLCAFVIFLSVLTLQYLLINSSWRDITRGTICLLLTIPALYFLVRAKNNFEQKSIQLYGAHLTETITNTYVTNGKLGTVYHAVYQYVVNGQTYTHTIGNYSDIYKIGDTIKIIYSFKHPDINKVVEYKSHRVIPTSTSPQ